MMANNYTRNLQRNYNRLNNLTEQMTTNRRFAHISDDPAAFLAGQRARYALTRVSDYGRTIDLAKSHLTQAETDLMDFNEMLQSAYQTAVDIGDDVKTEEDRQDVSYYIAQLRDHTLMTLNSIFGDKYAMGAYNTSGTTSAAGVKQAPFTLDADGNLCFNGISVDDPAAAAKIKAAMSEVITFDIGVSSSMGISVNGAAAAIFTDLDNPVVVHDYDAGGNIIDKNGNVIHKGSPAYTYNSYEPATGAGADYDYDSGSDNYIPVEPGTGSFKLATITVDATPAYVTLNDGTIITAPVGGGTIDGIFTADENGNITHVENPAHTVNNIYSVLDLFYKKLNSGASAEEISKFAGEFITPLQNAQSHIMSLTAEIGGKQKRLEMLEAKYEQDKINYTQMKSDAEDADEAELIMDFKMAETVYKAALATGNYVLQPTLMDFIK
jgi:flagellin-like hook-associated protein FlgL